MGILASLILLIVIIRFALSGKAEKPVKQAAVIALAVIGIAVVICLAVIARGPAAPAEEPLFAGPFPEETAPVTNPAMVYALIFGAVLVLFIALIIFLALRKKKKNAE
jgi:hypothetical protein